MKILVHSLPARAGHRHPGPGAADRRALLEVVDARAVAPVLRGRRPPDTSPCRASNSGRPDRKKKHVLISQRPTLTEESISETRSRFTIEPLEPGFGYTLGNSLRRTLLSSIPGAAVTSIKIDGVLHEFTTIPGVKEDVVELVMNVKELCVSSEHDEPVSMYLRKQGPGDVTAGDIQPPAGVSVHNPDLKLATLNGKGRLDMELTVERGRGYVTRGAEQAGRRRDRPDPGRLDLLAGAEGDLPRRGDPCRAAHRLRPADHRRRDQAVDRAAYRAGLGRLHPGRAVRPLPASWTRPPRASTSARRRRTRSWLPTWRCRSRSWTSPSGPTTASSARASTRVGELIGRTEADLLDIRNFGQKSIDEVKMKLAGMGLGLKDSRAELRPGARRGLLRRGGLRHRRLPRDRAAASTAGCRTDT